jgi:hypothetical protein
MVLTQRKKDRLVRALLTFAAALLFTSSATARAAPQHSDLRITVTAGNIFIDKAGHRRQLTRLGRNYDPALSPDHRFVVYTRGDGKPPSDDPSECKSGAGADQLRRIDIDGKNDRLLITGHNGKEPPQQLCRFDEKQFTADGRKLFFISPGWATSGALHVYDFETKSVRFVAPANGVIVLNFCTGKHRDELVLNQHRYFLGGGSYDWYWLYDPNGRKELGPVGDDSAKPEEIVEKARDMICAK